MLIGVGGSGKQSLTRLATYILEFQQKTLQITRKFGPEDFRIAVKQFTYIAGIEGKSICFLINDTQIINQSFLQDINNLLNTGQIPNLYDDAEDKQRIINQCRDYAVKTLGLIDSPQIIYKSFIQRVRQNLHIVLCMSPVGSALRIRCRKFPSLINCCTLDWFNSWPRSALYYVAQQFLIDPSSKKPGQGWVSSRFLSTLRDDEQSPAPEQTKVSALKRALQNQKQRQDSVPPLASQTPINKINLKEELCQLSIKIHTDIRQAATRYATQQRRKVYITPKSYLDLMLLYKKLLREKRKELGGQRDHLQSGVKKLQDTNQSISELKTKLIELKPLLIQKQTSVQAAIKRINEDTIIANKKEQQVLMEAEIVNQQTVEANRIHSQSEHELSKAKPQLQRAKAHVNNLDSNSIFQIRGFQNPPPDVQMVMQSVMILLKEKGGWSNIRTVLKQTSHFVQNLKKYDVTKTLSSVWDKLQKNFIGKSQFEPEYVAKKSVAASKMCGWVHALYNYSKVLKKVVPMQQRCRQLKSARDQKQKELKQLQDQLSLIKGGIAKLRSDCTDMQRQQERLQEQEKLTGLRLLRAEKLLVLLQDQGVRWASTARDINDKIELLAGDVYLAAVEIAYLGPFNGTYRAQLLESWVEHCEKVDIPISFGKLSNRSLFSRPGTSMSKSNTPQSVGNEFIKFPDVIPFNLVKVLGDPVAIRQWTIKGLPNDTVSIQNAIMAKRSTKWPLMIDPQGQAQKWIKNLEQGLQSQGIGKGVILIKASNESISKQLSVAVREGIPVLLSDCDETLDPILDSLLNNQVIVTNPGTKSELKQIRIADQLLEFKDQNFSLYMTTKHANPHFLPEVSVKVMLINFMVTFEGLKDQLLGDVVKNQKPEIEKRRDQLIVTMDSDQKLLKSLEAKILQLMAESTYEQILDDENLIMALEQSKKKGIQISENIQQNLNVEKEINQARNKYMSIAIRGTVVYFVISDLAKIDPMYEYSLQYVKRLFNLSLQKSKPRETLGSRLSQLISNVTQILYTNVSRGLFERHKIFFSFLLISSIYRFQQPKDFGEMHKIQKAELDQQKRLSNLQLQQTGKQSMASNQQKNQKSQKFNDSQIITPGNYSPNPLAGPYSKNIEIPYEDLTLGNDASRLISSSQYLDSSALTSTIRSQGQSKISPLKQNFLRQNYIIHPNIWEIFMRGINPKYQNRSKWPKNPFIKKRGEQNDDARSKSFQSTYEMLQTNWWILCFLSQKAGKAAGFNKNWKLILSQIDGSCEDKQFNLNWIKWLQQKEPVGVPFPNNWSSKNHQIDKYLSPFEEFFLLKLLRPEKLWNSMFEFVKNQIGSFYIQSPNPSISNIIQETDNKTPLIFILSQGADPTSTMLKYIQQNGLSEQFQVISLGQGQGIRANYMIQQAQENGNIVMLQNCHLAQSWMPQLQEHIQQLEDKAPLGLVHKDFRLILTSMPVEYFPVSVLQNGLKISTQPPRGLKNNMKRLYAEISRDQLSNSVPIDVSRQWHKLLFGLCFFHSVIQQRKKFGPLGWNIKYEFNESDWETSKTMLKTFLKESVNEYKLFHPESSRQTFYNNTNNKNRLSTMLIPQNNLGTLNQYTSNDDGRGQQDDGFLTRSVSSISNPRIPLPWEAMNFITGHINYGGRVTDDLDRICLMSVLHKFYTPKLLTEQYQFESTGFYKVPRMGSLQSYKDYIQTFPLNDENLQIFGLHSNANIAYQYNESRYVFNLLLEVQPRVVQKTADEDQSKSKQRKKKLHHKSNVSVNDPEQNAKMRLVGDDKSVFQMIESLMSGIPPLLNPVGANVKRELFKQRKDSEFLGVLESLSTVLLQQISRFNRLLDNIKATMNLLKKAILGMNVMSSDLDQMFSQILNQKVPSLWAKVAYPSLKPLASWFSDLTQRVQFMQKWLQLGQPASFWLSGFFFPQGFMTGVLQRHARAQKIPIDKLNFKFEVFSGVYDLKGQTAQALAQSGEQLIEEGVLIYGLFLQGARWSNESQQLQDQIYGQMHEKMPLIHFQPEELNSSEKEGYSCPVYKTGQRMGVLSTTGQSTNFILSVELPHNKSSSDFWTLRGTALLCSLSN